MSSLQIRPAFAVPMAFATHPGPGPLNQALRELFLAREAEGERHRNRTPVVHHNAPLYESHFRLFDDPTPCVRELRDFCWDALYRTVAELNGHDAATMARMQLQHESWFHVTRRGGFFGVHKHGMNAWSGVYCVRHDGDDPASNSGLLSFIDPNSAASMYSDPSIASLRPPFSAAHTMIRLQPGQLVLFPSWLMHEVLPYEGDTERITVAFNVRFQLAAR